MPNAAPPALAVDVASEKISDADACKTGLETAGTIAGMSYPLRLECCDGELISI